MRHQRESPGLLAALTTGVLLFAGCSGSSVPPHVWGPEVSISGDTTYSVTSAAGARCIAEDSEGNIVAVWSDYQRVHLILRRAGSPVWSDVATIGRNDSTYCYYPAVAIGGGGVVHVLWDARKVYYNSAGKKVKESHDIYYRRSTDWGDTWDDVKVLARNVTGDNLPLPAIAADGAGGVYAIWKAKREGLDWIVMTASRDEGVSFGDEKKLNQGTGRPTTPSIAASPEGVHAVWKSVESDGEVVFYRNSTNGGASWNAIKALVVDTLSLVQPNIAADRFGNVHVVWQDSRNSLKEAYYKRSTDNGFNWGADYRLTADTLLTVLPVISTDDSAGVYTLWFNRDEIGWQVFMAYSVNFGQSWSKPAPLGSIQVAMGIPTFAASIAASRYDANIIWPTQTGSNYKVLYRKGTIGTKKNIRGLKESVEEIEGEGGEQPAPEEQEPEGIDGEGSSGERPDGGAVEPAETPAEEPSEQPE